MLPFPKKLVWTDESISPIHSRSISSRSSDWRMTLLMMPLPGAALTMALILPKNMYFAELMVGACLGWLMTKLAPFSLWVTVVPSSSVQSSVTPCVKSVVIVLPSAGSRGQATGLSEFLHQRRIMRDSLFCVGLQAVKVWPLANGNAASSAATREKVPRMSRS